MTDLLAEQYAEAVCHRSREVVTELQQSPPIDPTLLRSLTHMICECCIESSKSMLLKAVLPRNVHTDSQSCGICEARSLSKSCWSHSRQHIRDKQVCLAELQSQTNDLVQEQLPGLIQDMAALQVSTVLHGDYSLKLARQDYFTSKQDKVHTTLHY